MFIYQNIQNTVITLLLNKYIFLELAKNFIYYFLMIENN